MLCEEIRILTERALWETENLIRCIPDRLWDRRYDGIPVWKYVYHTLYSMDRWYINPYDPGYRAPAFHQEGLADLNVIPGEERIAREEIEAYLERIKAKLKGYLEGRTDEALSARPENCQWSRFRLILGQFRHWHRHMGILYGVIPSVDKGRHGFSGRLGPLAA